MICRLVLILLLFPFLVLAQEAKRIEILGKISAPAGADVEGISVYNISSENGTISNDDGEFKLKVAENDRIRITALQFQNYTLIIGSKDISSKSLKVYLNPNVNQLGAVILRNTDLLGIAELDTKRIKTSVYIPEWDLSQTALEYGYNFGRDRYTAIHGNASLEALNHDPVPIASADVGEIFRLFFTKKRRPFEEIVDPNHVSNNELFQRLSPEYIVQAFGIPSSKVTDFVYFARENGFSRSLLKKENEIELLQYLLNKSEQYKEQLAIK